VNYHESVIYLRSLTDMERDPVQALAPVNFDLGRVESLLARLDSPHLGRRTIHVAGSKGKGSIATMIAAILSEAGLKVGLYTSPHLHRYEERLSVGLRAVNETRFATLATTVRPALEAEAREGSFGEPSTFEALTAMAFLLFNEEGADSQVLEVGLGGRLDATNVELGEKLCVIAPIGLEHTAILGDTVAAIAAEKAAIVGPGHRVVMAPQRDSAAEVIRARCATQSAQLYEVAELVQMRLSPPGLDGRQVAVQTARARYDMQLPLYSSEQAQNAATAVVAAELSVEELSTATVKHALAAVRLPGRQELMKRRPRILVDVAHTEDSVGALAQTLRELGAANVTLVFAPLADKRLPEMTRAIGPLCAAVVATVAPHPRAAPLQDVVAAFSALEIPTYQAAGVEDALKLAMDHAGDSGWLVVAGSFAAVAAAREEILGLTPALATGDPARIPAEGQ
jgi:dihydrofolate synthase/folylpolyglutamate synthase